MNVSSLFVNLDMAELIGKKNDFGIEYEFTDNSDFHNAKSRIWVKDDYLGEFENPNPIYSLYPYLNSLISKPERFRTEEFRGLSAGQIFNKMIPFNSREDYLNLPEKVIEKITSYDRFICNFNDSYDKFIIRTYIEDAYLIFLWRVVGNKPYKEVIHFHKVPLEKVTAVVNQLKNLLIEKNILKV